MQTKIEAKKHPSGKRSAGRRRPSCCSTLVPRNGYAVQISRDDGSWFLSTSGHGIAPAVWNLANRVYAAIHKQELIESGFKARIVRVIFADPIVQNVQDHASDGA